MKPYPVTFHLYAENESEANALRDALYNLVVNAYTDGVIITAGRMAEMLDKYYPLIKNALK